MPRLSAVGIPGIHAGEDVKVTARGQVTFRKDVLQHLGIKPGEQIDFDKLPGGELRIRVARPTGSIKGFIGLFADSTSKVLSIEEMNEITAAGWAGEI